MSESEFDIIKHYFAGISQHDDSPAWLIKGIGDDAAIISPDPDKQLLIAIDTLNAGIHFPQNTAASDLGYKALAVNLSDIAAMGAEPLWFTLALSLPESDPDWITDFCRGLSELTAQYKLQLIGGDTTRGPLSITIQIAGQAKPGQILTRAAACVGDDIYISGYPGEAALGLKIKKHLTTLQQNREYFIQRLDRPLPRIEVGLAISQCAHACIDVSDGLVADLGHILEESLVSGGKELGAELFMQELFVSNALSEAVSDEQQCQQLILYGGDDYELCFTAPVENRAAIKQIAEQTKTPLSRIGKIIETGGMYLSDQGKREPITQTGYEHFK